MSIEIINFIDAGESHLMDVLHEAFEQATKGKGNERHGHGKDLYDQPWMSIANNCGTGFLTGQAVKKLMEASSLNGKEGYTAAQYERELLGAIVYTAFAIMHQRKLDDQEAN